MGGMALTTNYRCPPFSGSSAPPPSSRGVVMMKVCVRFGVILVGPVLRRAAGVLGVFGLNQVAAAVEEELGPRAVGSGPPGPADLLEEERPSVFRGHVVELPVVGADLRGD